MLDPSSEAIDTELEVGRYSVELEGGRGVWIANSMVSMPVSGARLMMVDKR